jgi:predicted RNA binding protein YcfA (HicA-like mRNA interferase family)
MREMEEDAVPRKLRELRSDLSKNGFNRLKGRGKGDHEVWKHPAGVRAGLDGKDGQDAKPYQEKEVREAISAARRKTP